MNILKRIVQSISPFYTRAQGGTFKTCVPHGALLAGANPATLAGHGTAAWKYGAVVVLLAATANVEDAWVEEIVVSTPTTAAKEWCVALTQAAAIAAANDIEAEVPFNLVATTSILRIKLDPPAYFPAGTLIGAAQAGAVANKKVNIYATISRRR